MQNSRWLSTGMVVILIAVMMPLMVQASPSTTADQPENVESELWQAVEGGQSSDLIVKFTDQADLSAAYGMDWQARGLYVVDTLRAVAERDQADAIAYLDGLGLEHQTFLAGNELYVWAADQMRVLGLASLPNVAYVRAPGIYYLDPIIEEVPMPEAITDWGITDTRADQFWTTFGFQGEGIVVANIDTGVQWDHPALVNQFNCASPTDPACWEDPSNICGPGGVCDNNGHGTHTMGTMVSDDDPGLTYIAGMSPNSKWIACKGCESSSCSEYALNTCADWILAPDADPANRPHVVNNSWGGGGGDAWYLGKVVAWRASGIFPAFSAGNNYSCNSLGSPGDYQASFGSASHTSSRTISDFSSKGPSAFGHEPYTKPNISAPGSYICSTVPTDGWSCGYSGTSMASPHSAGAVALLWSCNPSLVGDIDHTFQILQDTADTPPGGSCGAPPDFEGNNTFGYGYLNVLAAGQVACGAQPAMFATHVRIRANPARQLLRGIVRIVDESMAPVAGAMVDVEWHLPIPHTWPQSRPTNAVGIAVFKIRSKWSGTYELCVTDVTAGGYVYDPSQNLEDCAEVTVP